MLLLYYHDMENHEIYASQIAKKYKQLSPFLNEKAKRLWCASEASIIGYGGASIVKRATNISRPTITKGLKELSMSASTADLIRIRGIGGGRKSITQKSPEVLIALDKLIDPATRGDPENPLRWSSKSTIKLAKELNTQGHKITQQSVYKLLKQQDYSMKSNRKSQEGKEDHPDRDAQFNFINEQAKKFQKKNLPVLSVDTKKKENLGNFKNNGKEWSAKGKHTEVLTHDFPDETLGKVAPHGIYDVNKNQGWISVGVSSDTAEFAANSIRNWYAQMGEFQYPKIKKIMITADCGGSNNYRSKLWKYELQKLANELKLEISVCHFPPGTSKWNKIEHRLFAQISQNWRGKPLINLQTVVELISNTTTATGLKIKVFVDKNKYETGKQVSDEDFAKINIKKDEFHGEWNYIIKPSNR
jgi:hypothetical protein